MLGDAARRLAPVALVVLAVAGMVVGSGGEPSFAGSDHAPVMQTSPATPDAVLVNRNDRLERVGKERSSKGDKPATNAALPVALIVVVAVAWRLLHAGVTSRREFASLATLGARAPPLRLPS